MLLITHLVIIMLLISTNYLIVFIVLNNLKSNLCIRQTYDSLALQVSMLGVGVVTLSNDYLYTFQLYFNNLGILTLKTLTVGLLLILIIKSTYKENE